MAPKSQGRCLFLALSWLLLHLSVTNAFFGFQNNKPDIPKTTKTGCVSWRQTSNCDGNGGREPHQDQSCRKTIKSGNSGFCECSFGVVARTNCGHQSFNCDSMCLKAFQNAPHLDPQGSQDKEYAFLMDSVWMWNNWREVKFHKDGQFWAPTPECQQNGCVWKVKSGKIFIFWGNDGMHTVVPDASKQTLTGSRHDLQPITAKFVRIESTDPADLVDPNEDLYDVMGIDVDATEGEIRKAYRKLSRELHPDKVDSSDSAKRAQIEAKFIKLQEAYEVLKNEDTRMVYDTGGLEAISKMKDPNQGNQRMDPFSMFFGGGGGNQNSNKGQDVRLEMEVDLALLYTGGETSYNFNRRVVCRRCSEITAKNRDRCAQCKTKCPGEYRMVQRRMGHMIVQQQEEVPSKERCKMEAAKLELLIEKGMKSGDQMKFERKNEQTPGVIPGDVIVSIKQKKHKEFKRVGQNDLKITKKISLKEALTGVDMKFNHLDGHQVSVKTTAADVIFPKRVISIKEEGMPFHNFPSQKGKLLVEFEVEFPKKLTEEQKQAINNLF